MASNRSALISKTHKVLKKHFKPVPPNQRLPLLEQLVYACCLEDATAEAADQAFAALEEQFFDWNEVRVSTVTELAEVMNTLSHPRAAAARVKKTLQSVFEANYSFDLEAFKKENIGAAVKKLQNYNGITPFCVSYVTQNSLGGHSVPIGQGALDVMHIVGAINDKEKKTGQVPGLERAIPKSKGAEFGSLLNQLGVEFQRTPFGPAVRKIILEIEPQAKDRLPKRRTKAQAKKEAAAEKKKKLPAKAASKKAAKKKPITKKVKVKKKKSAAVAKPKAKKKKNAAAKVKTKRVRRKPR